MNGPDHAVEAEKLLDEALLLAAQNDEPMHSPLTRELLGLVLARAQLHATLASVQFLREISDRLEATYPTAGLKAVR